MSVWQPEWLDNSVAPATLLAWRGVEAQHVVSTLRLVDTAAEQDMLEQLIEGSKPALPKTQGEPKGQPPKHYLLTTPFRYNPEHESRFRPRRAKGQWYGAEALQVACAEVAYWRHRFVLDSAGLNDQELLTEHTFFQAAIAGPAIDLMAPPWNAERSTWTHSSHYTATQALAQAAAPRGVHWLAYESARAPGGRCAVALTPNCLSEPPGGLERSMLTWHCKATKGAVLFTRRRERYGWEF